VLAARPALALDAAVVKQLATGDVAAKVEAVEALTRAGDPAALPVLEALHDGELAIAPNGAVVIDRKGGPVDALTLQKLDPAPEELEPVEINNRVRGQLQSALSAFRLFAPDRKVRFDAAKEIQASADASLTTLLEKAVAQEQDPEIKAMLEQTKAGIDLGNPDPAVRLKAVRLLGESNQARTKQLLYGLLEKTANDEFAEPEAKVREEAEYAIKAIDRRLALGDYAARLFAGISLGSILLLAALGLAITYGLLGVINMAHGEMIMIGAYATYLTQLAFRGAFPEAIAWYPVAALPVAFVAAAAVGIVIERTVIRWLYGRPLETLLATWGVSLVLIQAVRQLFGPQNVEIENPAWLSGGVQFGALVLPWNRIAIIVFSLAVLGAVALVLHRTRLGLFVRGVTQNRAMASAVGVPTDRVDMMAFGLGSGIAGLAGVALSQVGNVGPELGQAYVIDSFIVVVLGGVGQLLGTVVAGFGLGVANKLLEPWLGAVVAKIVILVLIIAFIQKRPSGLFALKGRAVET
jgi:urea transport system permease protein